MVRAVCRHCCSAVVSRPRGLCWVCHRNLAIRDLYPSTSKYARRGVGHQASHRPPPEPTDARPGTPEKLAVLSLRAERGELLWHPDDA